MEFFKTKTNIDFLGLKKVAAIISIVLFLASIISLIVYRLNFGLDFTGGTKVQLEFKQPANIVAVRDALQKAGLENSEVQSYGDSKNVMITLAIDHRVKLAEQQQKQEQEQLVAKIKNIFPGATATNVEFIGAKVSSEIVSKGVLALIIAMIATAIYIALRFESKLAIGSAIALIHDPVLILGVFSFFRITFDLVTLAAMLTVIGYSLNDTVIIFDRVRENFRKIRKGMTPSEIMNLSINQTLSRTIMTSGLTLMLVVVLFIFGGPTVHSFSLALMIGIVIGTYSSIYVAGALAVVMGLNRTDLLPTTKKEEA